VEPLPFPDEFGLVLIPDERGLDTGEVYREADQLGLGREADELERLGARLEAGLAPFGRVQRVGAMLTSFCRDGAVRDYDQAAASDTERYGALFRHLLAHGIYVAPSQFETLFVSLAHTDADVDRTIEAVADFDH
jgi:glutamate-1-semialdehyde 2,1-aminomutase